MFSATKQMKRMQGQDAEKLLSQWEKVAKCNFKSKLKYMKDFFLMKWNVICNAEDRFSCVRAFCRASHVRASMHRITSLELLRTLMLCLVQLSKWRECKATDAEKLLSQWEKLLNAILRVSSSTWKMFLSHEMKCYLQCRRQIFMFRAFLRAKNTNAVRASKNTNAVFSATKQKENARPGCWKASFSVRESC